MAAWEPLAQMDLAPGAAHLRRIDPPPSPTTGGKGIVAVVPIGLPWDRRQEIGIFPAFVETLKLVLLNPTTAFSAMKTEGGLSEPLIYAIIGGSVGFIVYFLFSLFLSSFGFMGNRNALAGVWGWAWARCFRDLCAGFDRPRPLYRLGHSASLPHPRRWRETSF